MGFKEVTDLSADTVIALGGKNKETGKANPKQIEGYYLGSRKVESRRAKSGFSYIHVFQTSTGITGVWGKTDMDRKVTTIPVGTMARVTSTGTRPTPNGDMYVFKVEFDTENTIEVTSASQSASIGSDSSEDYNDSTDSETDYDNDGADAPSEDDEELLAKASEAAAARKAKVQAILNGKGKKA